MNNQIDPTDLLQLHLAESQAQTAALRVELVRTQLRAKYAIGPGDAVKDTGEITRADAAAHGS